MAITRYRDPANLFGLQRLNRILDEAFAGLAFPESSVVTSTLFAPTDVSEDENALQITMELPGVNSDNVRLSLENNVLTIRGEKRQELDENNERVHRSERVYGVFERTFVLPNTVDPDQIEARFENGVLVVRIPKAERARPREIPLSSSGSGATQVGTRTQSPRVGSGQSSQGAGNGQESGSEAQTGATATGRGRSSEGSGNKSSR
ncbi:MAG: Hsp20/alpha crystallin family protein [Gemmatimonadales bacterium]